MDGLSEQDAIRDAYVASLEHALRVVARDDVSFEDIRELALRTLKPEAVVRIPDGTVSFSPGRVVFTHFPFPEGRWHLVGPAEMVVPGTVVEVSRMMNGPTTAAVGDIVAERTVIHTDRGPCRYVIARVSRAIKEED